MLTKKEILEEAIHHWFKETSGDTIGWGWCAETSLVVNDYLGGHIVFYDSPTFGPHYWNVLPDSSGFDLTRRQFRIESIEAFADIEGTVLPRERLLAKEIIRDRYLKMKKFVDEYIENPQNLRPLRPIISIQ